MPLQLPQQTILPSPHAKYLGVWLDKHLDFTTHRSKVIAKANSSLEAFRGDYRFHVGPASGNVSATEQSRAIRSFTRIQKRAALMVSGAFKSTSAAALDTDLFLTPINLLMHQVIEETAIRIQTEAPWARPGGLNAKRKPKEIRLGGMSPLEAMKWRKQGPLTPLKKRETAHGYAGLVGAAAIDLTGAVHQRHLGTDRQSGVYAAELSGMEMALEPLAIQAAQTAEDKVRELVIFSDSQAAIQAVRNPKRPSGQYVLGRIYDHVRAIRSRQTPTTITLRWIPAHVDVTGN
ncbi:uncharacterized protein N7498_008979 [Penicillium cinerascens]|uniref:RNase H type-1 domain-containing protein n=1 Tax=Penicillium cinerascens TaxID=70096 RepID=A0A9W9JJP6_9EURO|nr:uncharacterized protein N7498_008979 [Penicillium cinerascens]KAJ5195541.1 hypothetical protein N7498_008979 [Penicillium cinerascens]